MDLKPAHALIRFGLGRAGTEPPPADPTAWLLNQLRAPDFPWPGPVPSTAEGLAADRFDRENKDMPGPKRARQLFEAQAASAMARAVATKTPFRERLVWFWTNHFTVSLRRGEITSVAAAFVQEAIRPHVTGRFQDMLIAVIRHPAMILYLDNQNSVGPTSKAGGNGKRGLNENLARECMELHTVTPASGYTQADVTSFARILTGWSVEGKTDPLGFVFRPNIHEPGEHTLMGRTFPEGEQGGLQALAFLAAHPATHRHLATKLVTHFTADKPSPAAVKTIEAILRDTNGDLGAAAAGLVRLPEAWTPATKVRAPQDLMVATFRALEAPADPPPPWIGILNTLGQPLWNAPAPNGWSD